MIRKLLEDLWALGSSHFLAAEVLGSMPVSVHPLLVAAVAIVLAILAFRSRRRRKKKPTSRKQSIVFRVVRGPSGTSFGWERTAEDVERDRNA
jgi:hypothetical protein